MAADIGENFRVELRLLGEASVLRGGRPVPLRSRRVVALLARLACTGSPHHRDRLAGMFWPDAPRSRARGNLRVALSTLRHDVGDLLVIERDVVALAVTARGRVDVLRFEDAADRGLADPSADDADVHLQEAADLYRGGLLEGFPLEVGEDFEAWSEGERTRLHLKIVQVLEALVDRHLSGGGGSPSTRTVELASRLVDLEPYRESSQDRLARARWAAGDRAGALAGLDAWVRRARRDLGIDPSPALHDLVTRILRDTAPDGIEVGPDPTRRWPLVGRDRELAALARYVAAGRLGAVVLVAEAGTGATRLLEEALAMADRGGRVTARVGGSRSGAEVPYGAVAHLAPDVDPSEHVDVTARHLAYRRALTDRAAPPVIGLDDAGLLDAPSATVLAQLVHAGAATVLAVVRAGHPAPDAIERLWRDGWAERIDLRPLAADDVGPLLTAGLQGPVGVMTEQRVAELAAGSPRLVRELAIGAVAEGTLRPVDGVWRWDGTLPTSTRLSDALAEHLEPLDDRGRLVLGAVTLGAPVPLRVLEQLVDGATLADLEAAGLVTIDEGASDTVARPGHPLVGALVVSRLGVSGRRHVRRQLARAVEDVAAITGGDRHRLVGWRHDGGLPARTGDLVEAAERANEELDHDLAARLAAAAIEQGGGPRAALALATAATTRNDADLVIATLRPDIDRVLVDGPVERSARWLRRLFGAMHFSLGRTEQAVAFLDHLEAREPAPPVAALLRAHRVAALRDLGRPREAPALARTILAEADVHPEAAFEVSGAVMGALFDLGRTGEVRTVTARVAHMADHDVSGHSRLWIGLQELVCQVQEGRPAEVLSSLEERYAQVVAAAGREHHGTAGTLLGIAHLAGGTVGRARQVLRDAVAAMAATDAWGGRTRALCLLTEADVLAGDLDAAHRSLAAARTTDRDRHPRRFAPDLSRADALVTAGDGDRLGAIDRLLEAADRERDRPATEGALRHLAFQLGAPAGDLVDDLDRTVIDADAPILLAQAAEVRAVAADDAETLAVVAEERAAAGQLLWAATTTGRAAALGGDAASVATRYERRRALLDRCDGLAGDGALLAG